MLRTMRHPVRSVVRTALTVAAWNNRRTIAVWARSLASELRTGRPDVGRLTSLMATLSTLARRTRDGDLAGVECVRVVDRDLVVVEGDGAGVDVAANALGATVAADVRATAMA